MLFVHDKIINNLEIFLKTLKIILTIVKHNLLKILS